MDIEGAFGEELARIRERCQSQQKFSWTSAKYQRDLLDFIYSHRALGACVIEVGCYKGGLTAQLALICDASELKLYTIDVDPTAIESTTSLLDELGLSHVCSVFHGDLSAFVDRVAIPGRAVVCILDGDHTYDAVRRDIGAALSLSDRPNALAFHDFSLRHPHYDERVDEAVRDAFGEGAAVQLIGLERNGVGHPTQNEPQSDGHYWKVPGSEGAILTLGESDYRGRRAQGPNRSGSAVMRYLRRLWQ